jgi:hypothetical protein
MRLEKALGAARAMGTVVGSSPLLLWSLAIIPAVIVIAKTSCAAALRPRLDRFVVELTPIEPRSGLFATCASHCETTTGTGARNDDLR